MGAKRRIVTTISKKVRESPKISSPEELDGSVSKTAAAKVLV